MNYYKSNIFSIFLLIFAIIIFIVVGMFLVKIKKNNTIYEGIVGSSETPAWVIIGTKNNNITPMTGYSMDGINWTTKPLSGVNPSSLNCVACNDTGSLWLIGTNNGLVSSTDGINWTVNSNSTLNAILGSYWNKEKSIWINVGYIRQPTTGWAEASIEYSTNGTSWTKWSSPASPFNSLLPTSANRLQPAFLQPQPSTNAITSNTARFGQPPPSRTTPEIPRGSPPVP